MAPAFCAQRCSGLGRSLRRGAKCFSTSRGSRKRTGWGFGPSPVGKSISAKDRGLDALDGGFSSMPEDGSGKIRVVEREVVGFDEREDVRPVLLGIVACRLVDGVKVVRKLSMG